MSSFLEELAQQLATASKAPNVLSYQPNSKTHEAFHQSDKLGRILMGGNRAGKSVAGVVESLWRAMGIHPYQKTHDVPTHGRIVTVDKDSGIDQIIKPLLRQWTPKSYLKNGSFDDSFQTRAGVLTLANGSTIEIKTHQQQLESFAGVPRHWIWFDEECPQEIFQECRMRLIDYNGVWWMTMTPVQGQDWMFDRFILTKAQNVKLFEIDMKDNPHLNQAAIASLQEDLTDEEKEVREKGSFVPKGGLILNHFDPLRHVIPGGKPIPPTWSVYVSIDHGFNNPTAMLWHAVSPEGKVITFYEHYASKMLIKQHAEMYHKINRQLKVIPKLTMGDPSMAQKSGETGTSPLQIYRENNVPLMQSKRDVQGRNDKMNEYFEYNMWAITDNCPFTIKEIRGYSFDTYYSPKIADRNDKQEKPKKKRDHCPDSCGYFFNFMPHLGPEQKQAPAKKYSLTETNREDFPWDVDTQLMAGRLDDDDDFAFGEIR